MEASEVAHHRILEYHGNAEKIAKAMAGPPSAELATPRAVDPRALEGCDLVSYGSGIESGRHYKPY
jgi:hypothetical protein